MSPVAVVAVGDTESHAIDGLERSHGPVEVVRRCPELSELLAACQSGMAQVAVVAAFAEQLTATLVDRLTAVGVGTVAVAATADEASRLTRLGAHALLGDPTAESLATAVLAAVDARRHPSVAGYSFLNAEPPGHAWPLPGNNPAEGTGAAAASAGPGNTADGHDDDPPVRGGQVVDGLGRVVAVWGPIGSPGRTLLAVNMAAELAASGSRVLLIDADSYGASIAAMLGLLDESASFAQACRVADQGVLVGTELQGICTEVVFAGGSFALLTGLTRPDRWSELRAAAVERVLQAARTLAEVVVIDCGFCLENDEELSYDTIAPRRNAATLTALAQAQHIYAVGSGDTLGVPRLVRALEQLSEHGNGATVEVVLNKVRKQAAGRGPVKALEHAWDRFGPDLPISHHLPWDPDTTDAALLAGRLLLETAPESPLRRAIRDLCCAPVQRNQKPL